MTIDVDLTSVAVAAVPLVPVVLAALGGWTLKIVNAHLKGQAARQIVATGLQNALGIIQQWADGELTSGRLLVRVPGVPDRLAPGVNYALLHFPDALKDLGLTPEGFAEKLDGGTGDAKIQSAINADAPPPAGTVLSAPVVVVPAGPEPAPAMPPIAGTPTVQGLPLAPLSDAWIDTTG